MAGGTANKSTALLLVARSKIKAAEAAIEQLCQSGSPSTDQRHSVSDPAITAAITALQALV